MLGNNRFSNKDILSSINHLKTGGKFNKDLLNPNNKIYVGNARKRFQKVIFQKRCA